MCDVLEIRVEQKKLDLRDTENVEVKEVLNGVVCTAAKNYRSMKCGRNIKQMKIQVKCEGPKWLQVNSNTQAGRW